MYYVLTGALKRRFIKELRQYWQHHPKYRDDLVDNIQGKFSFQERPQHGIIVKTSGASHVSFSADNYMGIINSYCLLTRVKNKPGIAVEWVREDSMSIRRNGGRFPSAPGIYYVDITAEGEFFVDPLIDIYHEPASLVSTTQATLQHAPLNGTLRLYEMPSGFRLVEGTNYTLDTDLAGELTGGITMVQPLTGGRWLQADYRYPLDSQGPFQYREMHANHTAIPGVILAFGRRVEVGDQFGVIVHDIRRKAYLEFGGKWEVSLDFDVMSRDVYAQQEITDASVVYIQGVLRSVLSHQGIEIINVSLGGESEEIYDENGDDYFYNANFSVTVMTDWSIHVPIDSWIRAANPMTVAQTREIAGLTDDELRTAPEGDIKPYEVLGLETIQDPFWSGRRGTFEMIK